MKKGIRVLSAVALCWGMFSCDRNPLPPEAPPEALIVRNISMEFLAETNRVRLTWEAPDVSKFDYYMIFRTIDTITWDVPDIDSFESGESRLFVPKTETSFIDIPALSNEKYYYAVRTVKVNDRGDEVFGPLCVAESGVRVGSDVSFNINRGDLFTVTDQCSLHIIDEGRRLTNVRFSQSWKRYLVKAGIRTEVPVWDPFNFPNSVLIDTLVRSARLVSDQGRLDIGVLDIDVPLFEAADPLNSSLGSALSGSKAFPWRLPQGNGEKRVYAEITYVDGHVDTLRDAIGIAPWRISMHLRNAVGGTDETMRVLVTTETSIFFIYKPFVEFGVSIYADTTILADFDCWIITSQLASALHRQVSQTIQGWYQTAPLRLRLTGEGDAPGPAHDDENRYTYSIDPRTPEGQANLSQLKADSASFPVKGLVFPLIGNDPLNETCVPGSYWGETPRSWASGPKNAIPIQKTITGTPEENFKKLMSLTNQQLFDNGFKEFTLVARFKGKFFNDTRVAVLGGRLKDTYAKRSTFDLYPPKIQFRPASDGNQYWATNDCTIVSSINYALNNTSVVDGGRSDIVEVSMIIAKKDPDTPWNLDYVKNDITAEKTTIEEVLNLRHEIFPYPIKVRYPVQEAVEWRDIDPSSWPSGEYIMGIVTSDQFGNRGWAPVAASTATTPYTNPWKVTILTGR